LRGPFRPPGDLLDRRPAGIGSVVVVVPGLIREWSGHQRLEPDLKAEHVGDVLARYGGGIRAAPGARDGLCFIRSCRRVGRPADYRPGSRL